MAEPTPNRPTPRAGEAFAFFDSFKGRDRTELRTVPWVFVVRGQIKNSDVPRVMTLFVQSSTELFRHSGRRAHLSFWIGRSGGYGGRANASDRCAKRFPNKAELHPLVDSSIGRAA